MSTHRGASSGSMPSRPSRRVLALSFLMTVGAFARPSGAQILPREQADPPPVNAPNSTPSDSRDSEGRIWGFESDPFNPQLGSRPRARDPLAPNQYRYAPERTPEPPPPDPKLVLISEPDGIYIDFNNLLAILKKSDRAARGRWDPLLGVLRISFAGHGIHVPAQEPQLRIDGRNRPVAKPLRVRGGMILLPFETTHELLEAIHVEAEIEGHPSEIIGGQAPRERTAARSGSSAAELARLNPDSSARASSPLAEIPGQREGGVLSNALQRDGRPNVPTDLLKTSSSFDAQGPFDVEPEPKETAGAGRSFQVRRGSSGTIRPEERMTRYDTGPIGETVVGLTWDELADAAHRRLPERLTIISDPGLSALSDRIGQFASPALGLAVTHVALEGRRNSPELLAELQRTNPDVIVDLMGSLAPSDDDADFELWAVHGALWPAGASPGFVPTDSSQNSYAIHQFHNLALGSMLRGELARGFPERITRLNLSPSYLLRRLDAPSTALVVPRRYSGQADEQTDRLARAIAGGLIAYYRGMESAIGR